MDDRYVGKNAWMLLYPQNKQDSGKVRTGKIVGSDPMGLWIEQPNLEITREDGNYHAPMAHVLVRWDKIDELVVFWEGARSPTEDDTPVGFK